MRYRLVRVSLHLIARADRFACAKEDLIKPHQLQYFYRSHFVRTFFVTSVNNRKRFLRMLLVSFARFMFRGSLQRQLYALIYKVVTKWVENTNSHASGFSGFSANEA